MLQPKLRRRTRHIYHRDQWDELLALVPDASPLQSGPWGEAKAKHGWEVLRFVTESEDGLAAAQVLVRTTPLGPMFYIPRGPFTLYDDEGELTEELFAEIHAAARDMGAVFLKVELNAPDAGRLPDLGFRASGEMAQPRATLVVDLTPPESALLAQLERGTRYNIGLSGRKGVQVRSVGLNGLDAFYDLLRTTAGRDAFTIRSQEYYRDVVAAFRDDADILLAVHEEDVLAAAVLVKSGTEAAYLYGASSDVKRNLKGTQYLQWHCLLNMKAAGCTRYDMWGVPPELATAAQSSGEAGAGAETDASKPEADEHQRGDLWGVYQFKKGFGGKLVTFAGAWDYVYRPARYWMWTRLTPRAKAFLRGRKLTAA